MLSKRYKALISLILLVLLFLGLVAALPLWWPWVLPYLAHRFGASYTGYERLGYHRFRINGVVSTNKAGIFTAQKIEALVPSVWLWRCFAGRKTEPFVRVNSWSWKSAESRSGAGRDTPYAAVEQAERIAGRLTKWLPRAAFTQGLLETAYSGIEIPEANWNAGNLDARLVLRQPELPASLALRADGRHQWKLRIQSEVLEVQSDLSIIQTNSVLAVSGTILWLSNRIELSAHFNPSEPLPQTASVRAPSFEIPANLLRLPDYRNVTGALRADWISNRFAISLAAMAFPKQPTNLPPVDIQTSASGNNHAAQIDQFRISTPWLQAELAAPTRIQFTAPFLSQPALLRLQARLGLQPWFPARGGLAGEMIFQSNNRRFPAVQLTLSGSDLMISNTAVKTVVLESQFQWPRFELARARLETPDGSTVEVTGNFDLEQKTIGEGRVQLDGSFGRQLLPRNFSFTRAKLEMAISGPLRRLDSSANMELEGLVIPQSQPAHVKAHWTSQGPRVEQMQISVAAGASSLLVRGSGYLAGSNQLVELSTVELSRSNRMEMELQRPFRLTLRREPRKAPPESKPGNAFAGIPWFLELGPARWSGGDNEVRLQAHVNWPQSGTFNLSARGLNSRLVQDFLRDPIPEIKLELLSLSGHWTNGPVEFRLESSAELLGQPVRLQAKAYATGGTNGIALDQVSISTATQSVVLVQGLFPITLNPAEASHWLHIDPDRPLRVTASTDPASILWDKLADATGIVLRRPSLTLALEGTCAAPRGRVLLQLEQVRFPKRKYTMPSLDNLNLNAEITFDAARLLRAEAALGGQPVELTAELPLGRDFWRGGLRRRYAFDWRNATVHLKVPQAQLAPLSDVLPRILSPEGTAHADITLQPGGKLSGELSISGGRTRPLDHIGPIADIQAHALFSGQTVRLTNTWAAVGGQRVRADGEADLGELFQFKGLPPFHLHLFGTNVPLVRNPNLLMRADLDLSLTNTAAEPGILGGTVRLQDSLLLADLQSLVPSRTAGPRQRPPYFSVNDPTWPDWRLQLQVEGSGFMRVQTPLFRGKVSTSLRLLGTLKDPVALGETRIDSGAVTFPFGTLDVKQGFITLASDDPYHPKLFVTATGKRFGYDIKMEATGPVDAPVIQFSSSPPLGSEQIVLMLTTGQVPRGIGTAATTRQRAQGLALFVGRNLLSEFGLGFPGENRLSIRSGEQISVSGRPTYEVEYDLVPRWSVIGEYDRFDQFNLNLKWEVYSR